MPRKPSRPQMVMTDPKTAGRGATSRPLRHTPAARPAAEDPQAADARAADPTAARPKVSVSRLSRAEAPAVEVREVPATEAAETPSSEERGHRLKLKHGSVARKSDKEARKAGKRSRKAGNQADRAVRKAGNQADKAARKARKDARKSIRKAEKQAKRQVGGKASAEAAGNVLAFPEPAGKRRKRRWLIAAGSFVALLIALLAVVMYSPLLAVRNVIVEGNVLAPADAVQAALEPLHGRPLPQVGSTEVASLLSGLAPVKDVNVEAEPPDTLRVEIQERVPVALLKEGEQFVLVDPEGTRLAPVPDRAAVQLPVIDGATMSGEVFSTLTAVLGDLPADILAKLDHASASNMDSVELTLTGGTKVFWGDASQNPMKAKVLSLMLGAASPDRPVAVYDVSTPQRPVTR